MPTGLLLADDKREPIDRNAKEERQDKVGTQIANDWRMEQATECVQRKVRSSASAGFTLELSQLLRARYSLIYLQTFEELRALRSIGEICQSRQSKLYIWSRTEGVTSENTTVAALFDPMGPLKWIEELKERAVLVLKDYHHYFKDPQLLRKLRDLAQKLKSTKKNLLILSPPHPLPTDLSKDLVLIELPLPTRAEIAVLMKRISEEVGVAAEGEHSGMEALIDAATGLTQDEIENVLAKSLVASGKLEKQRVLDEKRQIVKKSGVLEFIENKGKSSVGGMQNLRQWLKSRKLGLTQEAREVNLPAPKGVLLVGVPGCGKSLTALAVSQEWQLPLIRLDLGRVYSGLVGSSEQNIREALKTTEAAAPCILWIDEIEKGLSGSQTGSSDGGTSTRVFGTVLTWMQEKQSPVFVIATANDISQLPPEFLRKGRFDEIFFVDLPSSEERKEIFQIQLERYGWTLESSEQNTLDDLAEASEGYSGAEIEQALISARFDAFSEGSQHMTSSHVISALRQSVPLSRTMATKIESLRQWSVHRARPAGLTPTDISEQANFFSRARSLERKTQ